MISTYDFHVMRRYVWRAGKWAQYATGKSLHNVPQGIGEAYVPNALEGYFNDLRAKTKWAGATDAAGIPVVQTDRGNRFSFPITVLQKGLGHWDLWILSRRTDTVNRDRFLAIADWAVRTIDSNGGWECWRLLNRGTSSPYSSMAQGQGVSVLARAFALTGGVAYLDAATSAAEALIDPTSAQGVARRTSEGLSLEEYPGSKMPLVLNGWIFSLMGLRDLTLAGAPARFHQALDETLETLANALPRYDRGYWSMYDLGNTIASPFYHRLHIAQLDALGRTFPRAQVAYRATGTVHHACDLGSERRERIARS